MDAYPIVATNGGIPQEPAAKRGPPISRRIDLATFSLNHSYPKAALAMRPSEQVRCNSVSCPNQCGRVWWWNFPGGRRNEHLIRRPPHLRRKNVVLGKYRRSRKP